MTSIKSFEVAEYRVTFQSKNINHSKVCLDS